MNKKTIGLDLGTSIVRIWTKENGIILRQPTVVSLNKTTGYVEKVGFEAKKIIGKTGGELSNVNTFCPVNDGVIAGVDETIKMLYTFFKDAGLQSVFSRPSIIVGVSDFATSVERGAVIDALFRAGAKSGGVALVREPVAAALGVGLPIDIPRGNMIVDIGSGTTQAAIFCFDRVVVSRSTNVGSRKFDEAIMSYMSSRYNINIGVNAAEATKIRIGSVIPTFNQKSEIIMGFNRIQKRPDKITVNSNIIAEALSDHSKAIIKLIKDVLMEAPPEICADIYDNGIVLTGGGSLIDGMAKMLASHLGITIKMSKAPQDDVINGIGRIITENLEQYIEYDP